MTDIMHTYREDLKDKSVTAKSSHAKPKRGKYMRTSSDYLSKKELDKMNGEPISYQLNFPYSWNSFNEMPHDIQKAYLVNLCAKFGVNINRFASMFGVTYKPVHKKFMDLGISGSGYKKFDRKAFEDWLHSFEEKDEEKDIPSFGPIKYSDFLDLSMPERKEFLTRLISQFNLRAVDLQLMWNEASNYAIYNQLMRLGIHMRELQHGEPDLIGFKGWLGYCGRFPWGTEEKAEKNSETAKNDISEEIARAVEISDNSIWGPTMARRYISSSETDIQKPTHSEKVAECLATPESECRSIEAESKNDISASGFESVESLLKYVKSIGGSIEITIKI